MWALLIFVIAFYTSLFGFKLWRPKTAEYLYERFGFDIGLFQIKLTFAARGRWVSKISNVRKCKIWFKFGAIISTLLVVPGLIFLTINLGRILLMISDSSNKPIETHELIFQPVLPGITFPWSEASFYGISLFICTTFHEFGHALAAECQDIKILGYGLFIFIIVPAAFVDLSTSELQSLSHFEQLKIYCAGVWHNLVLAGFALMLLFSFPYLLTLLYHVDEGTMILSVKNSTIVHGPNGLKSGDVITKIGQCETNNMTDFYACIRQESQILSSYCVNPNNLNSCSDCCEDQINNGSHLNFETNSKTLHCLRVREVINKDLRYCKNDTDCFGIDQEQLCVTPLVSFPSETLFVMSRKNNRKEFLFIGTPTDIYYGIESLTDYIPKYDYVPGSLPIHLQKLFHYTASFSLALALINIVPCAMLDGQFVVKALVGQCHGKTNGSQISKCLINFGSILLVFNITLTFFVMKWT